MDLQIDSESRDLGGATFLIFRDFVTRVAKIEELRSVGHQLLIEFQRELGFFGRTPLGKESKVIQTVIKANETRGMKQYVERGCRNAYMNGKNICTINLCEQGLRRHLHEVGLLLDDLRSLSEDSAAKAQAANQNSLRLLEKYFTADSMIEESDFSMGNYQQETEPVIPCTASFIEPSILMRVLFTALKKDFEMQERIILSLGLCSSLEELESYCLMWELRPFIDEDILKHCWKLIPDSAHQNETLKFP
ncbi:FAD-binding protein [Wolffia australiana]